MASPYLAFLNDAHLLPAQEVCRILNVNPTHGLSSCEIPQREAACGKNETPEPPKTPFWRLVLNQFQDLLVRILLAAALVSFLLAIFEDEGSTQEPGGVSAFVEPFVILLILVANAAVGVWQEGNAEAAIEALRSYVHPHAVVLREGKVMTVLARDVVVGDVCKLQVGMQIPADIRMCELHSTTFRVNQSILTGESREIMKFPDASPSSNPSTANSPSHPHGIANVEGAPTSTGGGSGGSGRSGSLGGSDDRWPSNMLFAGTTVSYGRCTGVVVRIGSRTEYGKIEQGIREEEEVQTPLKKKLDEFGELLSKVIGAICVLVWLVNIGHFTDPIHGGLLQGAIYYFKIAVALAVAAIPEGLPAVVTTCLALGTRKMAAKNALVRSLPSVETLGCTTVICSDKTGTLTTNMMSVSKIAFFGADNHTVQDLDVADTRFDVLPEPTIRTPEGVALSHPIVSHPILAEVAMISGLCNDASLEYSPKTGHSNRVGEATEAALKVLVEKIGLPTPEQSVLSGLAPETRLLYCNNFWEKVYQKTATLEFTRDRKSMSVSCISRHDPSASYLFVKGAPESLLSRSEFLKTCAGDIIPLTPEHRHNAAQKLKEYTTGSLTLRCLGLAYTSFQRPLSPTDLRDPSHFAAIESRLTFVGIVGMLDPPRPEVHDAISRCMTAGIRVIVITGDNKDTAEAICRRIGLMVIMDSAHNPHHHQHHPDDATSKPAPSRSYTGYEFDQLPEGAKLSAVQNACVFSRVDPSHKMQLVKYLQQLGEIVAMTGDGVNDAPALKKSDIGIAMGSGTEVAKAASKMVLSDDNFSTIVAAVEEGRAIYNNTKQFIRYLISSNIGEVVCIFLTAALGMPGALVPVQLLWVNLVTDGLPATALGFNAPDPNIMRMRPRRATEPIVNGWLFFRYLVIGLYVGVSTIMGFAWWYMYFADGPQLTYHELTHFHECTKAQNQRYDCNIFHHKAPNTVALSVLVTVEMFNALNALSEDESLLVVGPLSNFWLLGAIALSFFLHFAILHLPYLQIVFGVTRLGLAEWKAVVFISFPVVLIDEILKFFSRPTSSAGSAISGLLPSSALSPLSLTSVVTGGGTSGPTGRAQGRKGE